jgi:hypothetical protein
LGAAGIVAHRRDTSLAEECHMIADAASLLVSEPLPVGELLGVPG